MLKETALYHWHQNAHAKCVPFAGYAMPMHYGSQIEEHHAVRQNAGLFDVSHMGVLDIHGDDAEAFLRQTLANDVKKLAGDGCALYTCMLNESGGVVDDLIAYRIAHNYFRLVINASVKENDIQWLKKHAESFNITFKLRDDLSIIALQGPKAIALAKTVLNDERIDSLKRFTFFHDENQFVARVGYTGEDGVEILIPHDAVTAVWQALINAGARPCGLGARDTLRLEGGLNLYGHDMDENTSPLAANLAWTVDFKDTDRDFIGKHALVQQKAEGVSEKLVGLILEAPGVMRDQQTVFFDNEQTGVITSGGFSPTLGYSIALARIPVQATLPASIERRGKHIPVRIVQPPFVRNGKPQHERREETHEQMS